MGGKRKKSVKAVYEVAGSKLPRTAIDPDRYFGLTPSWSFSLCDFDHEKWGICRVPELLRNTLEKLKSYEGQTWGDILTDKSGRNGNTKNHPITTDKLIKDAQDRLQYLNLSTYDALYSLTITGDTRLWGIMRSGTFSIVWLDKGHKICPSRKRHT